MSSKTLWAISDLHLAIACPEKDMQSFGAPWKNYQQRIKQNWCDLVQAQDTVLISGDISWAMSLEQARTDLLWLSELPGKKILLKGNHDAWWPTKTKWQTLSIDDLEGLYLDPIMWEDVWIGGTRLWDHPTILSPEIVDWSDGSPPIDAYSAHDAKIFAKELARLEIILKKIPIESTKIICTHYPPIHPFFKKESPCSELFKKHKVDKVIFGHIHSIKSNLGTLFGFYKGIEYIFTAADHVKFFPQRILVS